MDFTQIIVAVVVGVPSFLLGFLAYRRSIKVDAVAVQAGMSSDARAGTAQIIEGLNGLIDNLQEDNKSLREEAKYLVQRIGEIIAECDQVKATLNDLHRKYGNGTT